MACKSLSSVTESCFNCHAVLNPFFYFYIEETKAINNEKTIMATHKIVANGGFERSKNRHFFNISPYLFPTHLHLALMILRHIKQKISPFDNHDTVP